MQNEFPTIESLLNAIDPKGLGRATLASRGRASTQPQPQSTAGSVSLPHDAAMKQAAAYLQQMDGGIQGQRGSDTTYRAACRMYHGFGLSEAETLELLLAYHNPKCVPNWSEKELAHKVANAAKDTKHVGERGHLRRAVVDRVAEAGIPARRTIMGAVEEPAQRDEAYYVGLGEEEDDPHRIARGVLRGYRHNDDMTLRTWNDEFYEWVGTHWRNVSPGVIRSVVSRSARSHFEHLAKIAKQAVESGASKELARMKRVTVPLVGNVVAAIESQIALQGVAVVPAWIGASEHDAINPRGIVAAKNGLAVLSRIGSANEVAIVPNTPKYFGLNAVGYAVNLDAGKPVNWLRFLNEILPDDPDSITLLQEWFGYLLTADISLQKMLLLLGPPRSGKGTITRVLTELVGESNVCNPTFSGLTAQYGVTQLAGKTVAIIGDGRVSHKLDKAVVIERLLTISGGDSVTFERKYLNPLTVKLPTRFVVATNEIPNLPDASGALASRWCVVNLTQSFLGKEDASLESRLLSELPGIFLWAVEGWKKLQKNRRFSQSRLSEDVVEQINEGGSPVADFVKTYCELGDRYSVGVEELYQEWKKYCEENGRRDAGTKVELGRLLRSVCPKLRRSEKRTPTGKTTVHLGIRLSVDGVDSVDRDSLLFHEFCKEQSHIGNNKESLSTLSTPSTEAIQTEEL